MFIFALLASMLLLGWYGSQAVQTLPTGLVGVVGGLYKGNLSCTQAPYDPAEPGVLSPTLPCGTQVMLYNPATGARSTARVVSQAVAFRPGFGRVADITPASAEALGLKAPFNRVSHLVVLPVRTTLEWLTMQLPFERFEPRTEAPALPHALLPNRADVDTLTRNMIAECGTCTTLGKAAIAKVTLNRQHMRFGGARTIRQVVYAPQQFSWTTTGPFPTPNDPRWRKTRELALHVLTERVSGDMLGLFYQMADADHFYATHMPTAPAWAARLTKVPLSARMERTELKHRFFSSNMRVALLGN